MPGKIYVIQSDSKLQALSEQPYPQEDHLQTFVAQYPDLLAGDQMNEAEPRRWLLVQREMGVPGIESGPDQWSLDHLFLDQDGVPTLVEVKRSVDTRIRREVVGQMLDYAANAVVYWSVETIRSRFEATCVRGGRDPARVLGDLLRLETVALGDVEAFWFEVKTNLRAGRIRMVFVADEIPAELRRIVEFLNTYMDPVEVLAVEVHQYVGDGLRTLVPRVLGLTAPAQSRKESPAKRTSWQWDESSFFSDMASRQLAAEAGVARALFDWGAANLPEFWWGNDHKVGSFVPQLTIGRHRHQVIGAHSDGMMLVKFKFMQVAPPFDQQSLRLELLARLNGIPGVELPGDCIAGQPEVAMALFKEPDKLRKLLDILDWFVVRIKAG